MAITYQDELSLESDLIQYLQRLNGSDQWQYRQDIKTTQGLWQNFKQILEVRNVKVLGRPLSDYEFQQVQNRIMNLSTPYLAGKFLYGTNGVVQIDVTLDDGHVVYLNVLDTSNVGAGSTIYQVVNQIERPSTDGLRKKRRFDTTLLINGLPVIQIEEKTDGHSADEALEQMKQYTLEGQYSDIYNTVQLLIGLTPTDVKYMARTTSDRFNMDFAFRWQLQDDNQIVRDWRHFAQLVLSIPMAHRMVTHFMILDGTPGKEMLKVMRPYQVYATTILLDKIKHHTFGQGVNNQKLGYIWHTTGSGKTISSFKAAWLASQLPNVNKVIFVVDRIALTDQTARNYKAYEPNKTSDIIHLAKSQSHLRRLLKRKGQTIIITSIQKLDLLSKKDNANDADQPYVFIVDEAHRSTKGESLVRIKQHFASSAFVGYTGTPGFSRDNNTQAIFGDVLHTYTIKEAIADQNVLGFKVDFENTINKDIFKDDFLKTEYTKKWPNKSEDEINALIKDVTDDELDKMIDSSVYDTNDKHITEVVKSILGKWDAHSNHRDYAGMLTTHVGGNGSSKGLAIKYYDKFKALMGTGSYPNLKIALSFSQDQTNQHGMVDSNEALHRIMGDYVKQFDLSPFGDDQVAEYTADIAARLNGSIPDNHYLDLVIVVDQFLTGFDAPRLNTLYVDRMLGGASLIQAYSRTNRIANNDTKHYGRIINYRYPTLSRTLMDSALSTYANRMSAVANHEDIDVVKDILAPDMDDIQTETYALVETMRDLTSDFQSVPESEADQEVIWSSMRHYNRNMNMLIQEGVYDPSTDEGKEELLADLGLTKQQEQTLTGSIYNQVAERVAEKLSVDVSTLKLKMTHVSEARVNYDYINELLSKLITHLQNNEMDQAQATAEQLRNEAKTMTDSAEANDLQETVDGLLNGDDVYQGDLPATPQSVEKWRVNRRQTIKQNKIHNFMFEWGIPGALDKTILNMLNNHVVGNDDLDRLSEFKHVCEESVLDHERNAGSASVRAYNVFSYRLELKKAMLAFADEYVQLM